MNKKIILILLLALIFGVDQVMAVKYIDARKLTLINKAMVTSGHYERVDTICYAGLPARAKEYSRYATGLAIVFQTDSRNLKLRWKSLTPIATRQHKNTTAIMQSGMDLYIKDQGQWIYANSALPSNETQNEYDILSYADGSQHECLLYLPLWDTVDSLFIGIDDDAMLTAIPSPFKGKVLVIGSSITHGCSASRPGLAWPARMQRLLGMEVCNLGFSGLCRLEEAYAHIAADADCDIIVIDGFSNPSAKEIHERTRNFVNIIRQKRPDTPIVFLQTEIRESGNFNLKLRQWEANKRQAAREEMQRLHADGYQHLYFLDPGMPIGDNHDNTVDGVHPTDAGFDIMVRALYPQLLEILNPQK